LPAVRTPRAGWQTPHPASFARPALGPNRSLAREPLPGALIAP
jgi:hypothetical protein